VVSIYWVTIAVISSTLYLYYQASCFILDMLIPQPSDQIHANVTMKHDRNESDI